MLVGRRRPLLRGALVGGTAYMVGRQAARRQQAEADQDEAIRGLQAEQSQAPAPIATTTVGSDVVSELTRLGELRSQGLLSDQEFAAAKAKLLGA
jgi:putative oligomerization/nucleic acid binding protein